MPYLPVHMYVPTGTCMVHVGWLGACQQQQILLDLLDSTPPLSALAGIRILPILLMPKWRPSISPDHRSWLGERFGAVTRYNLENAVAATFACPTFIAVRVCDCIKVSKWLHSTAAFVIEEKQSREIADAIIGQNWRHYEHFNWP